MFGVRTILALALLSMPAGAAQAGSSGAARISVDVNLVVLHVTVRGRKGDFVSGLRKQDFHVTENGRPQTIRLFQHEDIPVSLGLVVDNSSSMGRIRRDVTEAALAFVRSSNPRDEIFIVNFNDRPSLGLPPEQLFSADPGELRKALTSSPAHGMTALYDALEDGLKHLERASLEKKVLVVISDGGDNASHHKLAQVLVDAAHTRTIVYTVGLFDEHDADQNPGALKEIAKATGGEVFLPTGSGEIAPICERIAADIRHQYAIGYVPTDDMLDNTYRAVKVTVSGAHQGKLHVRTREGYIASRQP